MPLRTFKITLNGFGTATISNLSAIQSNFLLGWSVFIFRKKSQTLSPTLNFSAGRRNLLVSVFYCYNIKAIAVKARSNPCFKCAKNAATLPFSLVVEGLVLYKFLGNRSISNPKKNLFKLNPVTVESRLFNAN